MSLDPRQLRAFLAVVETGSLGRAAQALHLTEPAVSRIIKRLEDQLHVLLFERRTTGMELTTFGHALLPYASLLNTEANQAVEQIDALRGLNRGTLRVGAVASAAIMVLPRVLETILLRSPSVRVQVMEAVEDKLADALTNNTVDVVLSGLIPECQDIVQVAEHKFTDQYSVIASARNPLQRRSQLTMGDLHGWQWIMPGGDAEPRRLFNALIERLGITSPTISIETRSPSTIKAMVARTQFLGWLPEPLFAAEQTAGSIRPLHVKELTIKRHFFVYRRRRSFTPPLVAMFLEELKNVDATTEAAWANSSAMTRSPGMPAAQPAADRASQLFSDL
jgi:DNA-binding transcriptional LysR family regulator